MVTALYSCCSPIQRRVSYKWAGIILKYSTALGISQRPFPRERSVMYAFHTFHLPRAFLTCLVFLTLVDWWRNSFWQDYTEVTDRFEKKHSVPVGKGGVGLFSSCFMTLHPHGPPPPLPRLQPHHVSTEYNPVEDNPCRELSNALCGPHFSHSSTHSAVHSAPTIFSLLFHWSRSLPRSPQHPSPYRSLVSPRGNQVPW